MSSIVQAYIRRAESLRKALQSGRFEVPANLTYENVIADYCRGHDIKANVKAFVEAILVAIDNGKSFDLTYTCMLFTCNSDDPLPSS